MFQSKVILHVCYIDFAASFGSDMLWCTDLKILVQVVYEICLLWHESISLYHIWNILLLETRGKLFFFHEHFVMNGFTEKCLWIHPGSLEALCSFLWSYCRNQKWTDMDLTAEQIWSSRAAEESQIDAHRGQEVRKSFITFVCLCRVSEEDFWCELFLCLTLCQQRKRIKQVMTPTMLIWT